MTKKIASNQVELNKLRFINLILIRHNADEGKSNNIQTHILSVSAVQLSPMPSRVVSVGQELWKIGFVRIYR